MDSGIHIHTTYHIFHNMYRKLASKLNEKRFSVVQIGRQRIHKKTAKLHVLCMNMLPTVNPAAIVFQFIFATHIHMHNINKWLNTCFLRCVLVGSGSQFCLPFHYQYKSDVRFNLVWFYFIIYLCSSFLSLFLSQFFFNNHTKHS